MKQGRYATTPHESDPHKIIVADKETLTVKEVALRGRWLYVRKCLRDAEIGGIALCDKSREDNTAAEIMGIGEGCGKPEPRWKQMTKGEKVALSRKSDWCVCLGDPPRVGATVTAPDSHDWGIMVSPYSIHEFFIHECVATSEVTE